MYIYIIYNIYILYISYIHIFFNILRSLHRLGHCLVRNGAYFEPPWGVFPGRIHLPAFCERSVNYATLVKMFRLDMKD